jgi:D-proline reductase (dithiol) PrdB
MATLDELPLWLRTTLKVYAWRRVDPVPCSPLRKPIGQARVALVTSAGIVPAGQAPFDARIKGGDSSYRVITAGTDIQTLSEFHRSESFDHAGIMKDRNLAFPLDRLHELASVGEIGAVAPRHLSFMGSITAPGPRGSWSTIVSTSRCLSRYDPSVIRPSA